ncbi:hypothetical protein CF319_g4569 [Tilletia indica]|nr:hypothetical protein CF319_g4569 [Tilletia indica]
MSATPGLQRTWPISLNGTHSRPFLNLLRVARIAFDHDPQQLAAFDEILEGFRQAAAAGLHMSSAEMLHYTNQTHLDMTADVKRRSAFPSVPASTRAMLKIRADTSLVEDEVLSSAVELWKATTTALTTFSSSRNLKNNMIIGQQEFVLPTIQGSNARTISPGFTIQTPPTPSYNGISMDSYSVNPKQTIENIGTLDPALANDSDFMSMLLQLQDSQPAPTDAYGFPIANTQLSNHLHTPDMHSASNGPNPQQFFDQVPTHQFPTPDPPLNQSSVQSSDTLPQLLLNQVHTDQFSSTNLPLDQSSFGDFNTHRSGTDRSTLTDQLQAANPPSNQMSFQGWGPHHQPFNDQVRTDQFPQMDRPLDQSSFGGLNSHTSGTDRSTPGDQFQTQHPPSNQTSFQHQGPHHQPFNDQVRTDQFPQMDRPLDQSSFGGLNSYTSGTDRATPNHQDRAHSKSRPILQSESSFRSSSSASSLVVSNSGKYSAKPPTGCWPLTLVMAGVLQEKGFVVVPRMFVTLKTTTKTPLVLACILLYIMIQDQPAPKHHRICYKMLADIAAELALDFAYDDEGNLIISLKDPSCPYLAERGPKLEWDYPKRRLRLRIED